MPLRFHFVLVFSMWMAPSVTNAQLARPFEPKPIDKDAYAESMHAVADLADGTYVLVQFFVTNVGVGSEKGACKAIVLKAGQEPYSEAEEVKKGKWHFDSGARRLNIARCTVENTKKGVLVVGQVKELKFRLQYDAKARRFPMPDSLISDGEDFYEYEMYVPWSGVQAELSLDGEETRTIQGHGMIEHSRSTTMPRDVASRWIYFFATQPGKRVLLRMRTPREDMLPRVWVWREAESKAQFVGEMRVTQMDIVPEGEGFKIEAKLGQDHFTLSVDTFLYRYAPLEEYGFLGKMLQPWVGRPETRTYRATLSDKKTGTVSPGILEISSNYK